MGIRVHKQVGYAAWGFPALLKSPLQDLHGRLFNEETHTTDFIRWCHNHIADIVSLAGADTENKLHLDLAFAKVTPEKDLPLLLSWAVHYKPEFGLKDLILFQPPMWYKSWTHRDHLVDFIEESTSHNKENRAIRVDGEIYPYPKGPPPVVAGMLLWYNIPELWPYLVETLYVYWA